MLTLIIASLLNPGEGSFSHSITIRFTHSELQPREGTIALLLEGDHDLRPNEVLSLAAFGTVTTVAGPVAVLHTRMNSFASLENLAFISRIERPHPLRIYLDKSVPEVGADMVWREVKDPYGRNVTGAGIVIGFVDTGIDLSHPDFSFPNGTTKVLFVWDQTTPGRSPPGFGYGYECTATDIQARSCPEFDSFGHGTHVAGIAASSGRATGNYTGVAPDAAIVFVKSGHEICKGASWTFSTSQILDGINYIVKKAAGLGKRAVINLSLGGNIGAHDGTDPLERGLDAFVKAGVPIVVAAGNVAQDNGHARGQLAQGAKVSVNIAVRESTTDLAVDIWYSPLDQIDATLTTPSGENYAIPTPPGGAKSTYGNVTTLAGSFDNGNELYLEVNSTNSLPAEGWTATLNAKQVNSQGFWDAWVDTSSCSFPGAFFVPGEGYDIDPHDTIGIPGTAQNVVTVGAYVTKTSWRGMNNQTLGISNAATGGIASFSSLGPTRDGRIKPDVVAPGILIASARSSAIPRAETDPDPYHRILAGTSMAAPHVAGAIALMIQYAPNLEATEIPRILRETARLDANTGLLKAGSPVWGFGKVDTRTATGFFRLTFVIRGVPESVNVSLLLFSSAGDERPLIVPGGSWIDLYDLNGSILEVMLPCDFAGNVGTLYTLGSRCTKVADVTESTSSLTVFNYTVQYWLTVNSQYGPATESGWYNANATVKLDAPKRVSTPGFLGYFGAEYALVQWLGDDGSIFSDSVTMDRPRSVTPVYVLTYSVQAFLLVAILTLTVVLSIILFARRRKAST